MILHAPDSGYAQEMTKWEAQNSMMGPGLRPYLRRDYPMMMHRAETHLQGGRGIVETRIVADEHHRTLAEADGFRATPLEALEALEAQQTEFARLAAERAYEVRRMRPRAQTEVLAAEEAAGAVHLPTIAETPIRRRGRPRAIKE